MRKNLIVLIAGVALSLTACTKHSSDSADKSTVHVDAAQMDSEQLALAGEQLMAPHSFMLADKVFDMALAKDPTNKRAGLYKEILKPLMVLQGIGNRVRPLVRTYGDVNRYNKWVATLPNSSALDFANDGAEDIVTSKDAQELSVKYTAALFNLYDYLKANQDLTLTLNFNPFVFNKQIQDKRDQSCEVTQGGEGSWDVTCDYTEIFQTKINIADMIALRQIVAGEALYAMMGTTYSAEGIESLVSASQHSHLSNAQTSQMFKALPEAGKLRGDNKLARLVGLGSDLSSALKWVMDHQDRLCPPVPDANSYGARRIIRRKGFLFDQGLCIENAQDTQKLVATLDKQANGASMVVMQTASGDKQSTMLNAFAIARNPVQNIKSVMPSSYNDCDQAAGLQDKTLGGIFPQADAEIFVLAKDCRK